MAEGSDGGRPPPDVRTKAIVIANTENVRNILIKAKNEENNLCKLGPFAISRFIEHIVQTAGSVDTSRHPLTPLDQQISFTMQHRTGSLLVKTRAGVCNSYNY